MICPPRRPASPEPSWHCDQALPSAICHLPSAICHLPSNTLESTWPLDPAPKPQSLIHDVARLPPSQADSRLGHPFLAVCPQSAATLQQASPGNGVARGAPGAEVPARTGRASRPAGALAGSRSHPDHWRPDDDRAASNCRPSSALRCGSWGPGCKTRKRRRSFPEITTGTPSAPIGTAGLSSTSANSLQLPRIRGSASWTRTPRSLAWTPRAPV